jgi:hypothetical protein
MMRRAIYIAALVAAGCGGGKDWDEEIIVQLFRPQGTDPGKIKVQATQAGKTLEKEVSVSFADCTNNQVRIIPRKDGTAYASVDIVVTYDGGQANKSTTVPVPNHSPLKIVLGTGVILEPAACAPSIPRKPLGSACTLDVECEGGKCIHVAPDVGADQVFPNGYCTLSCTTDGVACAGTDGQCKRFANAVGTQEAFYCLQRCSATCSRSEYKCTTGGVCYPN